MSKCGFIHRKGAENAEAYLFLLSAERAESKRAQPFGPYYLLESSIVKFHHPAMDHESEAVIVPLRAGLRNFPLAASQRQSENHLSLRTLWLCGE
jgi:hypothetical protein